MPRKTKAHVRHAGIADEPVEILLAHGDPAAINEVAQAEPREDLHPALRGVGQQRQSDANQAVEAEFFQHAGMEHGGGGGGRAVAQRRPGVKRPERNQNAKAKQQQRENEMLGAESGWSRICSVSFGISNVPAPDCR